MFVSLIIQLSCYARYLLSFPTRRSSDLPPLPLARERSAAAQRDPPHRCARRAEHDDPPRRDLGRDPRRTADLPDRKSTRLNSSHTVISYAVFCLKKKKKS